MKWRVEFRRTEGTLSAFEQTRAMAVEVVARNEQEAKTAAHADLRRRHPTLARIFTPHGVRKA